MLYLDGLVGEKKKKKTGNEKYAKLLLNVKGKH